MPLYAEGIWTWWWKWRVYFCWLYASAHAFCLSSFTRRKWNKYHSVDHLGCRNQYFAKWYVFNGNIYMKLILINLFFISDSTKNSEYWKFNNFFAQKRALFNFGRSIEELVFTQQSSTKTRKTDLHKIGTFGIVGFVCQQIENYSKRALLSSHQSTNPDAFQQQNCNNWGRRFREFVQSSHIEFGWQQTSTHHKKYFPWTQKSWSFGTWKQHYRTNRLASLPKYAKIEDPQSRTQQNQCSWTSQFGQPWESSVEQQHNQKHEAIGFAQLAKTFEFTHGPQPNSRNPGWRHAWFERKQPTSVIVFGC